MFASVAGNGLANLGLVHPGHKVLHVAGDEKSRIGDCVWAYTNLTLLNVGDGLEGIGIRCQWWSFSPSAGADHSPA